MSRPALEVLAVGAHPDDVELFCGGTLALMASRGDRVTILDLTRGEMGSHGDPDTRAREAAEAAAILGVAGRENLDLGDARLEVNLGSRHLLATALRRLRPALLIAPHPDDPHPDHAAAGELVRKAVFDARLAKLDLGFPPLSPPLLLVYPGHRPHDPDVVVDITAVIDRKMAAIRCYRSQFVPGGRGDGTGATGIRDYLWHLESRSRHHGSLVDRPWGEGFLLSGPLALNDPGRLFSLGVVDG